MKSNGDFLFFDEAKGTINGATLPMKLDVTFSAATKSWPVEETGTAKVIDLDAEREKRRGKSSEARPSR